MDAIQDAKRAVRRPSDSGNDAGGLRYGMAGEMERNGMIRGLEWGKNGLNAVLFSSSSVLSISSKTQLALTYGPLFLSFSN